jgi:hypothetical protein
LDDNEHDDKGMLWLGLFVGGMVYLAGGLVGAGISAVVSGQKDLGNLVGAVLGIIAAHHFLKK